MKFIGISLIFIIFLALDFLDFSIKIDPVKTIAYILLYLFFTYGFTIEWIESFKTKVVSIKSSNFKIPKEGHCISWFCITMFHLFTSIGLIFIGIGFLLIQIL